MRVELAKKADQELLDAFQRLIPQLTTNNPPPDLDYLHQLLQDSSCSLLLAREKAGRIIGALTLTVYRVPTGVRSIIEDVIVDHAERGQGIGQALMERAIQIAREKGASNIALTSNPLREAANRLYLRLGFKMRKTNAYQLKL